MEYLSSRVLVRPTDPDRSLAFYRDVLGLAISREFPGGTVFFLGGGFLEVSGRGSGGGDGIALWLQVRDLAGTVEQLRGRGAPIEREPTLEPWGLREAWTADPDGTRIHLVEVPADHPIRRDTR